MVSGEYLSARLAVLWQGVGCMWQMKMIHVCRIFYTMMVTKESSQLY